VRLVLGVEKETGLLLVCCSNAMSCKECNTKFNRDEFEVLFEAPCFSARKEGEE